MIRHLECWNDEAVVRALHELAGAPTVIGQEVLPGSISDGRRPARAVDDIREQHGHQHPVQVPDGQPALDPTPGQANEWFVPHDPRVVARWNVDDIQRPGLDLGPVAKVNPQPPAEHHADVVDLAPLRPDYGLDVGAPPPAGLLDVV